MVSFNPQFPPYLHLPIYPFPSSTPLLTHPTLLLHHIFSFIYTRNSTGFSVTCAVVSDLNSLTQQQSLLKARTRFPSSFIIPEREMSCNGCRILRKGCNENCVLRQSLQGIDSPQAQANATLFVAKFFGRAGLLSFISAVPSSQRPALFQSLLYEACGRTVNPVNGAVGLLGTGNWHVCQSAVEAVLRGGSLRPMAGFYGGALGCDESEADLFGSQRDRAKVCKRKGLEEMMGGGWNQQQQQGTSLDFHAAPRMTAGGRVNRRPEKRRPTTPSLHSEESETTTLESGSAPFHHPQQGESDTKLLRLFL